MTFFNMSVVAAAIIFATNLTLTSPAQASETCDQALAGVSTENLSVAWHLLQYKNDLLERYEGQLEAMAKVQLTPEILRRIGDNSTILASEIVGIVPADLDQTALSAELACRGHARDDRGQWVRNTTWRKEGFMEKSILELSGYDDSDADVDRWSTFLKKVVCDKPRRQMVSPTTIANARLAELLTERAATIFAKLNDPTLSEDERSELRRWWEIAYPLFVEADSRLRPLNPELIRTGYDIGHALAIGLWIAVTSGDEGLYLECAKQGTRNDLNFRLPLLHGEVLYHRIERAVEENIQ